VADRAFELLIGERSDGPTVIADEVMMVVLAAACSFEAAHRLADLELRDEPERFELREDAIDAGARDRSRRLRLVAEGLLDLDR
jgi:hypothetical protein